MILCRKYDKGVIRCMYNRVLLSVKEFLYNTVEKYHKQMRVDIELDTPDNFFVFLETDRNIAQLLVTNSAQMKPYRFVCFEVLDTNDDDDTKSPLYSFYDSEQDTIPDILHYLKTGIDLLLNPISQPSITNEQRAKQLIDQLGFNFENISKTYIIKLLEEEIADPHKGSSEYLRALCGYLFCLGDDSDVSLLKKIKYGISMDVECMIDSEWITCLEHYSDENYDPSQKDELKERFIDYYRKYWIC